MRLSWMAPMTLVAALLVAVPPGSPADVGTTRNVRATSGGEYHDGVFGPGAREFCTATDTYTPSSRVRTRIVRSTDRWSNTIRSRYRKFVHCTARQMTPTMWCTTRRVDGVSTMCITPRPKATGASPCRDRRLDVRGVYHPATGRLEITCVNRY